MRYMLNHLWDITHKMPAERFIIDEKFRRDPRALALYIITYYNTPQVDESHHRAINELRNRGRGRPRGALNKDRVTPRDNQAVVDNNEDPFGVDMENEGKAELEGFEPDKPKAQPNNVIDLKNYVTHRQLQDFNYAQVSTVKQFIADASIKTHQTINAIEARLTSALNKIELSKPTVVHIKRYDQEAIVNVGVQHRNFVQLMLKCNSRTPDGNRLNIWLYGPAGTGKSTAAYFIAQALGLNFYTLGALESGFQILGYNDAHGVYQTTQFRLAFENGGIIMLDEQDSYSPSASLALNAALASGWCAFGDSKLIKRHKDCIVIAGANTTGLGGTMEYSGRAKQDAAFLNRFVKQHWPIDDALEEHLCPNKPWLAIVRNCRHRVKEVQLKNVMITPRASLYGCALLQAGVDLDEVIEATIKSGLTDAQWGQIKPPQALLDNAKRAMEEAQSEVQANAD